MRMALLVGLLVFATAAGPPAAGAAEEPAGELGAAAKTLSTATDAEERVRAGILLATKDPDLLFETIEVLAKKKNEADAPVFAAIAVQAKTPHVRLLLAHTAARVGDAAAAFSGRIDADHVPQSMRAIEALGYLRAAPALDRLKQLLRSSNETLAIQSARALSRVATKKDVKDLFDTALDVDSSHVRQHIGWTLRDIVGRQAEAMFEARVGAGGTAGFRAKEALAFLQDDETKGIDPKVKLDEIRNLFGRKTRLPPIGGQEEYRAEVQAAIEALKDSAPEWYHFVCRAVSEITLSGNEAIFEFKKNSLNLRLRDLVGWKDKYGKLQKDLVQFYVIRFAGILFYQRMGDSGEGHRGWEEGIALGWRYAIDHTTLAVDESLEAYLKDILNRKPPPW